MTTQIASQPLGLPLRQDDPLSSVLMIKMLLVTALLLAIVYLVMRWYAKRQATGSTSAPTTELNCTRALRLSTKTKVYLVSADGAQVLVTESSNGATVTVLSQSGSAPAPDVQS
ncbi:flagellar biosynthetic protein FliO [Pseudomonas palleroniana]|uniref:Uncharacterized protein n=1 Tax=Pseudomonas palleroniana TaxID=191390 RepID=A0A109FQH0_9PSED|nr:flagellar biosynthetic protein FliO [Pseudomonas palleroniana]KWU52870.1 hypothetical protein AWV77_00945 [Pseudomonas palleroniana]